MAQRGTPGRSSGHGLRRHACGRHARTNDCTGAKAADAGSSSATRHKAGDDIGNGMDQQRQYQGDDKHKQHGGGGGSGGVSGSGETPMAAAAGHSSTGARGSSGGGGQCED